MVRPAILTKNQLYLFAAEGCAAVLVAQTRIGESIQCTDGSRSDAPQELPKQTPSSEPRDRRQSTNQRTSDDDLERIRPFVNAAEFQIYEALWKAIGQDDGDSRLVCIGFSELGARTALTKKTVKRATSRLRRKGFIEKLRENTQSQPTTYRVFSPPEILSSLRFRGVFKSRRIGGGVKLIAEVAL
jgi:hypothetical protein